MTTPVKPATIVEKLTPVPLSTEESKVVKPPMTPAEEGLLARAKTFVGAALRRHGIQPNADETHWIGAEVADFVVAEKTQAAPPPVPAAVATVDPNDTD